MPNTTNPSAPLYGDYRDFSKGGRYGPTGENAPQQTGIENGRNQFDYWETDPEKVNAYLAAHDDDPALVAAASQGDQALDNELHKRGIRVPEHYKAAMGQDGKVIVKEMSWWDKHKGWAMPAAMVGGAIVAGPAIGALGGGSAPAGGALASTQIGSGFVPAVGASGAGVAAGAGGGALAATALPQAMSTLPAGGSAVLAGGGGWGALEGASKYIKPAAGAINTAADALASNRGEALSANQYGDQIATNRQAENRAERGDAWKKLQQASYVANRSTTPQFANLSPYAPQTRRPASPEELQGAGGLSREALLRLLNGPQIKPLTDVDEATKMGGWEKFLNIAGPVASVFGR